MSIEFENEIKFIDEKGQLHVTTGKLAAGGQGIVFKTKDPNILIKLALKKDESGIALDEFLQDEKSYKKFKRTIEQIRLLNLPSSLPIAKPGLMLESPYSGYILRMLTGMQPIENIIKPAPDQDLADFYLKTGGLKRRLLLLLKLSKIFTELNSHSIVYADISHGNIFISSDIKNTEVWLIDPDNMRKSVDYSRGGLFTPGYGAPEVMKGAPNTIFSDRYSFAILAFYVLGLTHPFKGKMVTDSEEDKDSWDSETVTGGDSPPEDRDIKAEFGEYPWIEDKDDSRNRSNTGIPRDIVLSKNIRELFQKIFGEEGKRTPSTRPEMREWYEAFKGAYDGTLSCDNCKSTYYNYKSQKVCPFCDTPKKPHYIANIYDNYNIKEILENDLVAFPEDISESCKEELKKIPKKISRKQVGFKVFEISDEEQFFMKYHTEDSVMSEELLPTIFLKIDKYDIVIKNIGSKNIEIYSGKIKKKLGEDERIRILPEDNILIIIQLNPEKSRYINIIRKEG